MLVMLLGPIEKMLILLLLIGTLTCAAVEKIPGSWTESGVLPYSYDYARNYLGHQMRREGWVCKKGFTAGKKREQEHSVWQRGNRKMQMMIWRIETGKTGYSKGEIIREKRTVKKR